MNVSSGQSTPEGAVLLGNLTEQQRKEVIDDIVSQLQVKGKYIPQPTNVRGYQKFFEFCSVLALVHETAAPLISITEHFGGDAIKHGTLADKRQGAY